MVNQRVSGSPSYMITTGWHHNTNLLLVSNNDRKKIHVFFYLLQCVWFLMLLRSALNMKRSRARVPIGGQCVILKISLRTKIYIFK